MRKVVPASSPETYLAGLSGWQRDTVVTLRAAVRSAAVLDERIKWGHLVYSAQGPVLLIRAEPTRVLFGFWRGQRLRELEPRLKPGGKYEMATASFGEGAVIDAAALGRLVKAAVHLNRELGDPTRLG